jgi:hypothetical protein
MKQLLVVGMLALGLFLCSDMTAMAQHHGHYGGRHYGGNFGGYGVQVGGPRTVISVGFGNVGGIGYGRGYYGGGYYIPAAPVYRPVYPVAPIYGGGFYGGGFYGGGNYYGGGCNRGGYGRW